MVQFCDWVGIERESDFHNVYLEVGALRTSNLECGLSFGQGKGPILVLKRRGARSCDTGRQRSPRNKTEKGGGLCRRWLGIKTESRMCVGILWLSPPPFALQDDTLVSCSVTLSC